MSGAQSVYEAIKNANGEHLTIRKICEITGHKSTSTVHSHIKNLEKMGKVRRVVTYEATK